MRASLILLLIAWIGCYFPWTATTGTAFSVNLFDLAEWTSLDPTVRGGNPALLPTFLLRATVGLIAFALATKGMDMPNRPARWLLWLLSLLIGIGLLPPLDFFRGPFDDPNYRQQFAIALITVIGVGFAVWLGRRAALSPGPSPACGRGESSANLTPPLKPRGRGGWRVKAILGISILAFLFSIAGATLGIQALAAFGLRIAPGIGLAVTAITLAGAGVSAGIQATRHVS